MKRRPAFPPGTVHAARVALAASLLIGVVYAGCVTVLDRAVAARLVAAVDGRLQERLADVREAGVATATSGRDEDDDADQPPVYLWRVTPGRPAAALSAGAPRLPPATVRWLRSAQTAGLRSATFRLDSMRYHGALLVAGQSLAEIDHIEAMLGVGEALAGPVLLLAVFIGSLVIGWRALSPVEQSRQRQLEFTADASHELRAPLTVIAAETSIALAARRTATEYRSALTRIEGESDRLRRIVEDLLWLARFDSQPPPPGAEPLDLATIAGGCADRFRPVARSQSTDIRLAGDTADLAWIRAPHEWIDRLAGVLVDNACRHAGPDGTVLISVSQRASRVSLTVEDSGPGIAPEERDRLFDRFHHAVGQPGGAGLGLAIANSIVRSTSGQWRIGDSPLGGALLSVSWRRARGEREPIRPLADPDCAARDPAGRPAGS
jgi:signal transduction histidine kinase